MPTSRLRRIATRVDVAAKMTVGSAGMPLRASDALSSGPMFAVNDLATVIANLQSWIVGILGAVATLFLVIGFARYMTAGGDPSETERAKGAFKAAAIGYAGALLAPFFMSVLQGILGV